MINTIKSTLAFVVTALCLQACGPVQFASDNEATTPTAPATSSGGNATPAASAPTENAAELLVRVTQERDEARHRAERAEASALAAFEREEQAAVTGVRPPRPAAPATRPTPAPAVAAPVASPFPVAPPPVAPAPVVAVAPAAQAAPPVAPPVMPMTPDEPVIYMAPPLGANGNILRESGTAMQALGINMNPFQFTIALVRMGDVGFVIDGRIACPVGLDGVTTYSVVMRNHQRMCVSRAYTQGTRYLTFTVDSTSVRHAIQAIEYYGNPVTGLSERQGSLMRFTGTGMYASRRRIVFGSVIPGT